MWLSFTHPNDHPKLLNQNFKPDTSHILSTDKKPTKKTNKKTTTTTNKLCQLRLDLV